MGTALVCIFYREYEYYVVHPRLFSVSALNRMH